MDIVYRCCCGIDVHLGTVAVCALLWGDAGRVDKEKRIYGTTTGELRDLARWLEQKGVTHIAMEATGVYWEPVWNVLEQHARWEGSVNRFV